MPKQKFILAQFPITKDGLIAINTQVLSVEIGLRKATRKLGPLTPITVAEMDGVRTEDGREFMIFFGDEDFHRLCLWLSEDLKDGLKS